ncbi:MAG: electron transfer flavoprotein-ubiquinone oxidoreductase [Alphaproteobacteria bacterium]|nr:electron transfer flavoprotein-ubiquinone oxidoreductase [Alphaproteobacteria bacterium]
MADTTEDLPEREAMEFDVVIVGAGPAGLAAAIRLRQLAEEKGSDLTVVVLEKGSEVGAHILSGAVVDPSGLDRLLPGWRDAEDCPLQTKVTKDRFYYLRRKGKFVLPNFPLPPLMNNHGNYVGSLGDLTRWLGEKAESLGVEIYPGFAASEILFDERGAVAGVATGDMGVAADGAPKDSYTPGIELRGKYTLFAEGARGSLSKRIIRHFDLDRGEPQKFGIGLKELWEIDPEKHNPGYVQHSFGWPLDNSTGGGSFLYHYGENLVAVGFVVHLNYGNPYLSPYDEFQRFKTHPVVAQVLDGGRRISYGARAITEGGWQSMPKLAFPGGCLIGCAAGFVNLPRIKGSHNAIHSGIEAAETVIESLDQGHSRDELAGYESRIRKGPVGKDLKTVRNVKPLWSNFGTLIGFGLAGIDMWANTILPRVGFGFTLRHRKSDAAATNRTDLYSPIDYPRPDGKLTFDKLTNVSFSATNHEEDQPVHLILDDPSIPLDVNLPLYAEPAQRYCPAGVYEVIREEGGAARFQINAQNCVHCKTCDIKDPSQNITWVCPEGGGGPNYSGM